MTIYPDRRVAPVAEKILECLRSEAAQNPDPPGLVGYRIGTSGDPLAGTMEDECCQGLAYVRVNRVYPSDNVPNQNPEPIRCVLLWAAEIEIGIWRCAPVGTLQAPPSQEEWDAFNVKMLNDFRTLDATFCCFQKWLQATNRAPGAAITEWAPKGDPEGGCFGSSMTLDVDLIGRA